jgi:hypothetical protein
VSAPLDDGGPAFPHPDYLNQGPDGMSLRDHFAGQAMLMKFGASGEFTTMDQMGQWCYDMADAMLKARSADERQQGGGNA